MLDDENIEYSSYEWDENKRIRNLEKHGLDFADIVHFDWGADFTWDDVRQRYPERRYATMGPLHGRIVVFAWCKRGEKVRMISLRKANKREVSEYDREKKIVH